MTECCEYEPVRLASIISPSAMVHAMLSFQLRSKALEESAPSSWPPAQGAGGTLFGACRRGSGGFALLKRKPPTNSGNHWPNSRNDTERSAKRNTS